MAMLGVPYGDAVTNATELARTQAEVYANEIRDQLPDYPIVEGLERKQVVALIAYLQRLGTDISLPPPAESDPTNEEGAAQ